MAKTIVGLYDDHQEAKRAHETLIDHDFDRHKVHLIERSAGNREDIVKRLLDSGVSEGDAHSYAEGVSRGGCLVLVKTDEDHVNQAVSLMNQFRPVDIDRRMDQWRSEGWRGSATSGVGLGASSKSDFGTKGKTTGFGKEGESEGSDILMGRSESAHTKGAHTGEEKKLEVIEEELRVGKTEVEGEGGIRATTRITEKPVHEEIKLREEKVDVERRPVDKEISEFQGEAFREEEIEFKEFREEPIVEKRARVIEEVILSRDVTERTETIEETVKRQDVDIERLKPEFKRHYDQSFAGSGSEYSFDDYSKGYSFGSNLGSHSSYHGRSWNDVEPEARNQWEEKNEGTWESFKDSVRYGFDRVRGEDRGEEAQPMA